MSNRTNNKTKKERSKNSKYERNSKGKNEPFLSRFFFFFGCALCSAHIHKRLDE